METLSHKFIEALATPRDRLYALALAKSPDPAAAETRLQHAACAAFHALAQDSMLDVPASMEKSLLDASTPSPAPAATPPAPAETPMPADVWARLAAVVQLEASRSDHAQALHPDSDLLRPDPMLAPKKGRPHAEPPEFDVSSPGRLFMLLGAAVFLGLALTVYVMTRPHGRPISPTSRPTPTAPDTAPSTAAATTPATTPITTSREAP